MTGGREPQTESVGNGNLFWAWYLCCYSHTLNTSYFQCRFNATGANAGLAEYACHDAQGLNSAYYDGHVRWVTIPAGIAATWWDTVRGNDSSGADNKGVWPYVAYADTQ